MNVAYRAELGRATWKVGLPLTIGSEPCLLLFHSFCIQWLKGKPSL